MTISILIIKILRSGTQIESLDGLIAKPSRSDVL